MKCLLLPLVIIGVNAQAPQPDGAGITPGTFPSKWNTGGPDCSVLPPWQVHPYNNDFYILRESGCVHYEKPFLYLIFGESRALLLDTGAGKPQSAKAVESIVAEWAKSHGRARDSVELIVAHTHGHDDHTAGDPEFAGKPNVQMVPLSVSGTQQFFHIQHWPEDIGSVDLGNRIISVIPIPGHDALSLAFYDARTGILLTGDTLYPGRLYIADLPGVREECSTASKLYRYPARLSCAREPYRADDYSVSGLQGRYPLSTGGARTPAYARAYS